MESFVAVNNTMASARVRVSTVKSTTTGTRLIKHHQMWFPREKKFGMQNPTHVGTDVFASNINCTVGGLIHVLILNFIRKE